jgi:uncharacterized protein
MADKLQFEMDKTFENSNLLETPNREYINELTYKLRDKFYNEKTPNG